MNDVGILSLDNLLAEDSHIYLIEAHANLLGRKEGSLVKFAGPYLLDGLPSLRETALSYSKLDKTLLNMCEFGVTRHELKLHHKVLALVEHLVHPLVALGLRKLLYEIIQFSLDLWVEIQSVLLYLERDAATLWKIDG